ncbi:MAG: hypothetical protein DKT66_03360 [Candidatus Melainabacteria bacterium]|nr:MAG: hypothetical protein DKT66_03360 [Candidatus Melainabacteria bacterium]
MKIFHVKVTLPVIPLGWDDLSSWSRPAPTPDKYIRFVKNGLELSSSGRTPIRFFKTALPLTFPFHLPENRVPKVRAHGTIRSIQDIETHSVLAQLTALRISK